MLSGKITDQYDLAVANAEIRNAANNEVLAKTDTLGSFSINIANIDSVILTKIGHETVAYPATALETAFILERDFAGQICLIPFFISATAVFG